MNLQYILIGATSVCGISDLMIRKIPNIITYPLMLLFLGFNIFNNNLKMSILGFSVAFLIGFVGFLFSQFGAGDVKLMIGIGAAVGVKLLFEILVISSILGLIYASIAFIFRSIKDRSLKNKFFLVKYNIFTFNNYGLVYMKEFLARKEKTKIPFGTCLALGLLITTLF